MRPIRHGAATLRAAQSRLSSTISALKHPKDPSRATRSSRRWPIRSMLRGFRGSTTRRKPSDARVSATTAGWNGRHSTPSATSETARIGARSSILKRRSSKTPRTGTSRPFPGSCRITKIRIIPTAIAIPVRHGSHPSSMPIGESQYWRHFRHHHRVGRLGRLVRRRSSPAKGFLGTRNQSRLHHHLAVRKKPSHSHAVRVRQHTQVHRGDV